jgi:hypothetical protein
LWVVGITGALHAAAWLVEQALLVAELPRPAWLWPLAGLMAAVLAGIPALLLALLPSSPVIRATGRAWATGALLLAVLALARAVPVQHNTGYLLLLALLAAAGTVGWRPPPGGVLRGTAAGLAALIPWLCLTALGGLLETLAAVAAAAAVGRLAARLLDFPGPARVWLRGLVAIVVLTLVAAGTGAGGAAIAALIALPLLGFAAALLGGRGVAVLVGLGALGPLAFVEPVQASLLLGLGDEPRWVLTAALLSAAVGLLSAALLGLISRPLVGVLTALALGASAVVCYVTVGRPGLYGDELFVVLKTQASLADLPSGVPARRAEVYRRLVDTADRTQAPLRRELSRLHIAFTPFYLVNGLEVSGGPALRAWLSARGEVDRVLLNPRLRPVPDPPGKLAGRPRADDRPQWNVSAIGADRVWAGGDTGQGIVVGGSDSGVDGRHPALADGFRGGVDSWYDPAGGTRTPTDYHGHGTHTLGTAVGSHGIGVAPGARWIGCVDLPRDLGNVTGYLRCLQYMLAPFRYGGDPLRDGRPERSADVLVNSWGCPELEGCDPPALRPAVDALSAAGIFVTAAAGNSGPRCGSVDDPPARYPSAYAVGATDRSGTTASFSSRGNGKPDLLAPGVGVVSALPGGGYGALSGTSMATPHVAGVVALMWAADPKLVGDIARTRALLARTATPVAPTCATAPGLVNADAAVRAARAD